MSSQDPRAYGRTRRLRTSALALALIALVGLAIFLDQYTRAPRFLHVDPSEFVALFAAPPAAGSTQTRRELDELLATQRQRTPRQIASARADRKTEVWQFAHALGLESRRMRQLAAVVNLAEQVEDDVRPYVRAAKHRFRRLRPYEIEPRLEPCIGDVRGDLSYPSGHATYGYVIAYLLSDMVPERREQLLQRAREFARQRMLCGVHFPSDVEAGRIGAVWLARRLLRDPDYRAAAEPATRELRSALGLAATSPAGDRGSSTPVR
jgi:acid phosphatase (class A)